MKEMMLTLYVNLQNLLREEDGQDLVEYALIVALIALSCCAGLKGLAGVINDAFFANTTSFINNAYSK